MSTYCVYKHTTPSGKVYIGITSQSLSRRWRPDGSGYRQNYHFSNAIKKYGWDNIDHVVVRDNLTKEEACLLERELVSEYRSYDPMYGYNRTSGGDYPSYSEEARRKISDSVSALWDDLEYRKHMSEAHKGKARTGWHHTEETKLKLSSITIERSKDPEYRQRLSDSAKKRVNREEMSRRSKEAWASPELREKQSARLKGNNNRSIPVICIETGIRYKSAAEAARCVGLKSGETIRRACEGKVERAKRLHWRLADE